MVKESSTSLTHPMARGDRESTDQEEARRILVCQSEVSETGPVWDDPGWEQLRHVTHLRVPTSGRS
jgi:hypothetical protein